jgi:hypothetical protein
VRGLDARIHPLRKKFFGGSPDERSDIRERTNEGPDIAEPVIGRAFARPIGSSGLNLVAPHRCALKR